MQRAAKLVSYASKQRKEIFLTKKFFFDWQRQCQAMGQRDSLTVKVQKGTTGQRFRCSMKHLPKQNNKQ